MTCKIGNHCRSISRFYIILNRPPVQYTIYWTGLLTKTNSVNKLEAQPFTFHSALRKFNTEPSIGASHQISVHFGKAVSEKKIFINLPIGNKNCLWWACLLMDQNKMSKLYRGPSMDASYQVSGSFGKAISEEKIFKN